MLSKKILKFLFILLITISCVSCNKWLDVKPKDQLQDTELYETEVGFKEALSGVYATLVQEPLYGKEVTFGLVGILGHEWDQYSNVYEADARYDYPNSTVSLSRINAIWNQMYFAVANVNNIIASIDAKKKIFTGNNYSIIKGEALALRAFIHFDLLRLFGASMAEDPNKLSIPYVTAYSKTVFPQLTVNQVIDKANLDLDAAAELLKLDPIYTGVAVSVSIDNGYLLNRQVHLNYYAVRGLQARIYLYAKNYPKALVAANEVINSTKFNWVAQSALTSVGAADLTFSPEHIFAFNVVSLGTIAEKYFVFPAGGSNVFNLKPATLLTTYFEGNTQDYRYLYQFAPNDLGPYYLKKYYQLKSTGWPEAYKNKLPVIRLSEMYFIAAECLKDQDINVAAGLINTVRNHRGLSNESITSTNFYAALQSEFRKEFIGEGQLFFYYKRLNLNSIPGASDYNLVTLKAYKLPLPLSEFENASGRVDNR